MFSKKNIIRVLTYSFSALILAFTLITIKVTNPSFFESFDNKIRDYMFNIRGLQPVTQNVVIIDIDELSLSKLGQWPWGRNKIAKILDNLTKADVSIIGLDIVFAEKDRSSPVSVFKDLNMSIDNIPDFDKEFNHMVSITPTILGYQFELGNNKFVKKEQINLPVIIVERNKTNNDDFLINATGTILNHNELQLSAYSSGFFNNIPDESGMVRNVPMLIRYDSQLYPSLPLEIIRASLGINSILVNYNNIGIENIQIGNLKIPTDRFGRLIVNFRGPSRTFKYISAVDIYEGNFKYEDIKGKIALMGTSAAGLNDLRSTAFDSVYPGVEVHASIIDNIIAQDFLRMPSNYFIKNILIIIFLSFFTIYLVTYSPFWMNSIVGTSLAVVILFIDYYFLFYLGIVLELFLPLLTIFLATLISTFLDYIFEVQKEHEIKKKFASKVSLEVMNSILLNNENDSFWASDKEITIFFSDIRGFTGISEVSPNAKMLIKLLNEYMTPMTQIIIQKQGTVDKFIGDSIMAYWNAPSNIKDHASKAVNCALEQLHMIESLNKKIINDNIFIDVIKFSKENQIPIFDIGIGINTGLCAVGEMGSSVRNDYTAIGDPVNIASRLESLCKVYDSKLNITKETKDKLSEKYIFRYLDSIAVKGKSNKIEIWQIHDYDTSKNQNFLYKVSKEQLLKELDLYHVAISLFKEKEYKKAIKIFKDINSWDNKTNNNIYNIYIKRCNKYLD